LLQKNNSCPEPENLCENDVKTSTFAKEWHLFFIRPDQPEKLLQIAFFAVALALPRKFCDSLGCWNVKICAE